MSKPLIVSRLVPHLKVRVGPFALGPLSSRKQTCAVQLGMSALGQQRTFAVRKAISALPSKSHIHRRCCR
jgi:hypothetical protein